MTRFDCSHLAQVNSLAMQKFLFYCTVFALCYFEFEGNFQVQAPRGLYLEGRFIGGRGVRFEFGGLIHGGAYFQDFTIFELQLEIEQTQTHYHSSNFNKLQDWNCPLV